MLTFHTCLFRRLISDFCSCYCFLCPVKEGEVIKNSLDTEENTVPGCSCMAHCFTDVLFWVLAFLIIFVLLLLISQSRCSLGRRILSCWQHQRQNCLLSSSQTDFYTRWGGRDVALGIIWPVRVLLLVIHEIQRDLEARLSFQGWWVSKRCCSSVCQWVESILLWTLLHI